MSIVLFIGLILCIFVESFDLKLDFTKERELLLWYNGSYNQRKYIKLFKI